MPMMEITSIYNIFDEQSMEEYGAHYKPSIYGFAHKPTFLINPAKNVGMRMIFV